MKMIKFCLNAEINALSVAYGDCVVCQSHIKKCRKYYGGNVSIELIHNVEQEVGKKGN
ncbi:hypothetical protein Glove_469g41 [Diversispora epigaea]|uniref:Uncharacterized protein n=1 Tax=Diversispora epigaea TaxID=1348612 RepID=A0A397GMR8_9GLOM|nr:hypothetical protein Glove_469g41 [Diversispora epigaea]